MFEVKYRKLADMHPHPKNPRRAKKNGIQELAKSISDNPDYFEVRPIVLSDRTGELVIIDGERRYDAAKYLGMTEAPSIVMSGLSPEREEELLNRANTHAGEWDLEKLKQWTAEQLTDWGVEELPEWETPKEEAHGDGYNPDEAKPETKVKKGQIFLLGEHRLMCGDSTDPKDLKTLMGGDTAALLLTDPPYNVDYAHRNEDLNELDKGNRVQKAIANDDMTPEQFRSFLSTVFRNVFDVMKPGCPFYVFTPQGHNLKDFIDTLDETGLNFRQQLIWVKNNHTLGRMDYQGKHEPILYGWKEGKHYFTSRRSENTVVQDDTAINLDAMKKEEMKAMLKELLADKAPVSAIHEKVQYPCDLHPTMKPVHLIGTLMENSTLHGDVVLDMFGGSGTTLIAAEQLQRKCYTMELDEHYVAVIIDRWEKFTGRKAEKIK